MTTWVDVSTTTTTYTDVPVDNGYVVTAYVVGGYISAADAWTVVASVSTSWVPA